MMFSEPSGDRARNDLSPGLEPLEPRVLFNGDAILALGDSITASSGSHYSYRYYLWTHLIDAGIDFDFVGTQDTNRGSVPNWPGYQGQSFDRDHEGHAGRRVDQINDALPGYLGGYTPDVALIHLGTNDFLQGQSASSTINELRTTVALLRADNPDVDLFIAQIIPTDRPGNGEINDFNAMLPALAAELSTAQSQVVIVDQNSGFSINNHLRDGVHPNEAGEQLIAQRFYNALADYYSQAPAPDPNADPNADAGANHSTTDHDGNGSQTVTLNGSGSSDPDGSITSYVWRRNGSTLATGANPTLALAVGTHHIQLTVTDNDGATDTDTVILTVHPQPDTNQAPQANAGPDRVYYTSNGRFGLSGSATDPDGDPLTSQWSVVSGPGTVSFDNAASLNTQVTINGYGTYVLRLTVSDGSATDSDLMQVTIHPPNLPPTVDAGPDRHYVTSNGRFSLAGSASDSAGTPSTQWSVVSGPGSVSFDSPASLNSQVTLSGYGTYVLRLTANDGQHTATDDIAVTISPPSGSSFNVLAGPDRSYVTNNGRVTLAGQASGVGVSTWWSIVSAPGTATFTDVNSPTTQVTLGNAGTYILRLNATDGVTTRSDNVAITIQRPV